MTKREQLLKHLQTLELFRTSDVIRWGLQNYHTRADRDKRDFIAQGDFISLTEAEKESLNYRTNEGVYCTPKRYALYFGAKQLQLI